MMVSLSGMVGGSSWLGTWGTVGVPVAIALLMIWVVQNGVKTRKGPIRWPLLGSTVEVLWNYDHLSDWLVPYFEKYRLTFRCVLVDTSYVFTADPANVEYILKTNFNNYPKVCMQSIIIFAKGILAMYGVHQLQWSLLCCRCLGFRV